MTRIIPAPMLVFLPTFVDEGIVSLLERTAPWSGLHVSCSKRFVDTTVIRAKQGVVIPLINWNPQATQGLRLTVSLDVPTQHVSLASAGPVRVQRENGRTVFTFDLDVADALILR